MRIWDVLSRAAIRSLGSGQAISRSRTGGAMEPSFAENTNLEDRLNEFDTNTQSAPVPDKQLLLSLAQDLPVSGTPLRSICA